jgi:hypothetical protein
MERKTWKGGKKTFIKKEDNPKLGKPEKFRKVMIKRNR